jgi:hypothetical protein
MIRFDNGFYRICPAEPKTVEVEVFPGHGKVDQGVVLEIDQSTLYVEKIAGRRVERYPSTLDLVTRDSRGLDQALHDVPGMKASTERFPLEMLLVFCVAESLRFDAVARRVDEVIKYTNGWLLQPGDALAREKARKLEIGPLYPLVKNWEKATDAAFRGVSPRARQIAMTQRALLSQDDRRHYERVTLEPRDLPFSDAVRSLAVLHRPTSTGSAALGIGTGKRRP